MQSDLEIKAIIHYKDGYFGKIEVKDNPEAPEIATDIVQYADDIQQTSICISDKLLPKVIKALQIYSENKKKAKQEN